MKFTINDGILELVELENETEVVIPDNITSIGYKAFFNCRLSNAKSGK